MDKNNIIGLVLIFGLVMAWSYLTKPSEAELARQQAIQDSLENVAAEEARLTQEVQTVEMDSAQVFTVVDDSTKQAQLSGQFGPFALSGAGEEQVYTIENEVFKVTVSNKGGQIKQVELKDYKKLIIDSSRNEVYLPLLLLEDEQNKFNFDIDVAGVAGGKINSGDLFFKASPSGDKITFRANAGQGAYVEQVYSIKPNSYEIKYDVNFVGMDALGNKGNEIELNWINYIDRIEHNTTYEQNYTSIYYKEINEDPDNCSCTSEDSENVDGNPVKWVSHSNQFFNSSLIADGQFSSALLEIGLLDESNSNLKRFASKLQVPLNNSSASMRFYVGPNEFKKLASYEVDLEDIIPYGSSVFGTINRWVIRPIFNFLSNYIGNKGIVILLLTFIVKLVLFPLTYKMLHSQSKMGALKPQLAKLKEKNPDDQQAVQMETMKMYREFGVNPLGGCFPIALQMPIWFALYRFFPASIEFRQASFLWATDLSSYDVFVYLPFEIPFYGAHVSLFTILWALTTVIYTYYNTKHMDMNVNPAMKYMQYGMPIMFLFFFNNYASGLSCYLFFSNILNITQTIGTKNYLIDQEKIKRELEAYRKKPKKKGGFQDRLAEAMKQAQVAQAEKEKKKGKKK
jgi:YidC/Oxa1 family membrane protein insertase